MRHHFRRPQAKFYKGSLFYSHCAIFTQSTLPTGPRSEHWGGARMLKTDETVLHQLCVCSSRTVTHTKYTTNMATERALGRSEDATKLFYINCVFAVVANNVLVQS
jgi:hypothetical protein